MQPNFEPIFFTEFNYLVFLDYFDTFGAGEHCRITREKCERFVAGEREV